MTDFELGEKVRYRSPLVRRTDRRPVENRPSYRGSTWKVWDRKPHYGDSTEGIVVGTRQLNNGIREWLGEDGFAYYPMERFDAVLIASDLRRNPVLVRVEDVERMTERGRASNED